MHLLTTERGCLKTSVGKKQPEPQKGCAWEGQACFTALHGLRCLKIAQPAACGPGGQTRRWTSLGSGDGDPNHKPLPGATTPFVHILP